VHGSGVVETVSSTASAFSKVSLTACDGRIDYDASYSVVVEIDDNARPYLHIEQDARKLEIRLASGVWYDDVTGKLSGSATDSSDLHYKGKPSSTHVSTSDSSTVARL
jgi:hypothetical protein